MSFFTLPLPPYFFSFGYSVIVLRILEEWLNEKKLLKVIYSSQIYRKPCADEVHSWVCNHDLIQEEELKNPHSLSCKYKCGHSLFAYVQTG